MHATTFRVATGLGAMFDELAACGWRASLLGRRLPALVEHAGALAPRDRLAWLAGLRQVWERHGWALAPSSRSALLELAAAWSAWPLAVAVGESLHRERRLDGADALRMMDACARLGDLDTAIDLAVAMQLAHPAEQAYARAYGNLAALRDWRDAFLPAGLEDEELYLEPLGHQHAAGYSWQYYDPAISELCCLPNFETEDAWHRWLERIYGYGDQQLYAVMHRDWGMIGSVSLILHGTTGYFYYWIGRDFQGYGFGPRAASLMLAGAQRHAGMRCCFAKVYDYNAPSRKALEKIGFEELGIAAAAPDDDQLFYRFGEPAPRAQAVDELHTLLDYMQCDVRPAVPVLQGTF